MTPAEKKKAVWLGGVLGVLALYSIYSNFLSDPAVPASHPAVAPKAAPERGPMTIERPTAKNAPRARPNSRARNEEFNPAYLANRVEDRPDPTKIDPTLRMDYFTKVQEVDPAGGKRNLFAFGQPPPPPPVKTAELPKGPEPIVKPGTPGGGPAAPAQALPPADPPLHTNLKYYGIVALSEGGQKTACLLDNGEEILLATEGDTLKRRFRVTRIGANSLTVQDTESKKEETIPLTPDPNMNNPKGG